MELKTIINSFEIEGGIESIQQLNIGLVNTNYLVVCSQKKYVLQQINTTILKNVSALMENIVMVNADRRYREVIVMGQIIMKEYIINIKMTKVMLRVDHLIE